MPALVAVLACNHTALAGSRVVVSLDALRHGATPGVVGLLLALFALLPMLMAVPMGRLVDRIGSFNPLCAGTSCMALGIGLPTMLSGVWTLWFAAPLIGLGFMTTQVSVQHAVARVGNASDRSGNFGLLSLGSSTANFAGPLIAGIVVDLSGNRAAFSTLLALPAFTLLVLFSRRSRMPRDRNAAVGVMRGTGAFELLRLPSLRRLFLANMFVAIGWDVHTVFLPVYGVQRGLSGSQIGLILASFAAASFVVRFGIGWVTRRWAEEGVLRGVFAMSALAYLMLPMASDPRGLAALSFALGLGLGTGQPVVMSLLQQHAPPGRLGEAAGIRISLIQTMAVSVPLAFGALGTTLGVEPVFWITAACLAIASATSGRRRH